MRIAVVSLALVVGGCAGPSNDGDRGELTFRGDELPLVVGRPGEVFVNRLDSEIRRIIEARCESDACNTFIIDEEEIDVTAYEPGLVSLTVMAELEDGTVVEDSTYLPFVGP